MKARAVNRTRSRDKCYISLRQHRGVGLRMKDMRSLCPRSRVSAESIKIGASQGTSRQVKEMIFDCLKTCWHRH